MQTTDFSLKQVAATFKNWRSNKLSKFEPVPDSLKQLVKQLMPLYSKMQIIRSLGISYRFLRTLSMPVKPRRRSKIPKQKQWHDTHSNHSDALPSDPDLQFINFRISDISDSSTGDTIDASHNNICTIVKPNGAKLILHHTADSSSSLVSIIGAFLCSN